MPIFKVFGMTQLEMSLRPPAPEVDALPLHQQGCLLNTVKNIVAKGEIARYEQYFL